MTTLPTPGKDLRIVTSRCSSCCPGASVASASLFRQPVELGVGVCDLAVHELEPLGHCLEMGCGRAHGAGCDGDRCCAQAFERLGRGEAPDAMALQQSSDSPFTDLLGLLRCRHELPEFQEPGRGDVVGQLQHLRIVAPQQLSDAIAEPIAVVAKIIADAGPFAQLDDDRVQRLQAAQAARVRPQRVGQHVRVAAVVLGAGGREAVPEAVELLGIDGVDAEAALHQAFHHGAVRHLDGDRHGIRRRPGLLLDPGRHLGQALAAVGETALAELAALGIDHEHVVRLRCPVDAHEPVPTSFLHDTLHRLRAAAVPADPCTGARRRGLPTRHPPWHPAEARVPPRGSKAQGAMGRSR